MSIEITNTYCQFEREPLLKPFGFKGGYMKSFWQAAAKIEGKNGNYGTGLGTQSVLWSDPEVFAATSESGGNSLMFAVTDFALQLIKGRSFENPITLQEEIFDDVYEYARTITGRTSLSKTFALNALVPVDNAAWVLYARSAGFENFDQMIPREFLPALSHRHQTVACIPLATYGLSTQEISDLVKQDGFFILKLKLGAPGSQQEMLEKDKKRIEEVHRTIGDTKSTFTENQKIPYYLDANGRYESKETLEQFLDYTKQIGAFDHIRIMEEPFPEHYHIDVRDLGINIAADESAHTAKNVVERIEMGYGAIALKPAAKTLSMTLKMALAAHNKSTSCFCADLTVNPILVDWNKNVAARLAPLPGIETGLLESNGHQNYLNWDQMLGYHPVPNAPWIQPLNGVFTLDNDFYSTSGGIFKDSPHYTSLLE